jgi:hypothetical protein
VFDRESFASEKGAKNTARLAKQLEFVMDVEIVAPKTDGLWLCPEKEFVCVVKSKP